MNKKNTYLLSILLVYAASSNAMESQENGNQKRHATLNKAMESQANNSQKRGRTLYLYNINQNKNTVNNEVSNINGCECTAQFGTLLDQCMNELDRERFVHNFINLDPAKRKKYLTRNITTTEDYRNFIKHFTPEEWEAFWDKLTPEEQGFIPKTPDEQRKFIENIETCLDEQVKKEKRNARILTGAGIFFLEPLTIVISCRWLYKIHTEYDTTYITLDLEEGTYHAYKKRNG